MLETCPICQRPTVLQPTHHETITHPPIASVYAVRDFYGCDSGCDGYRLCACDARGNIVHSEWSFDNSFIEDSLREMASKYQVRIDWGACRIDSADWNDLSDDARLAIETARVGEDNAL